MTGKIETYRRAVASLADFMAGVHFLAALALRSAAARGALAQADPLQQFDR